MSRSARNEKDETKGARRRRHILDKAMEEFAARGYHGTSISHIIEGLGIARATFYLYFKNKKAIFSELLNEFVRVLSDGIKRIDPADPQRTVKEQMRENVMGVLSTVFANRSLARIVFHGVGTDPDFDRRILSFYDKLIETIRHSLVVGMDMGVIRPCDDEVIACCIVGSMKELLYQAAVAGRNMPELERLADELLEYNIRGLFLIA